MPLDDSLLPKLKNGLVVSCQPVPDSPMDTVDIVVAMAKAAELAGAAGLRIESTHYVAAVKKAVSIPVIGIVKRIDPATPVVITPTRLDVKGLAAAGADITAIDATSRSRPESVESLIQSIVQLNMIPMADCSCLDDGEKAQSAGAQIIGTTLSGYTEQTAHMVDAPDFELIRQFADLSRNTNTVVMAEGRINTPELAAEAFLNGADCITVGSAITRIEHVVDWFNTAIKSATV